MDRFLVVLTQVMTLFLLMGAGFVLGKMKLVTAAGTKEMTAMLLGVISPCLILNAFQMDWDVPKLIVMGTGTLAMLGCYILCALLMQLLYRKEGGDLRTVLRFGSMYGNVGYMGIPLVGAVLGGDTVIFAVLAIVVFDLMAFTHGAVMMGGKEAFSIKKIVTNPVIVSVVAGLVLMLTRISLPGPVYKAVDFIGAMNTPLAMMIIGVQLSRADLARTFGDLKLYHAAAVKQVAMPVLTALVLLPFPIDPTFYTAIAILAGAPVAGFTSLFAELYDREVERSAQLVSLSTLLSVLTLPLVAVMAEMLAR